jgi:hypothetical protein
MEMEVVHDGVVEGVEATFTCRGAVTKPKESMLAFRQRIGGRRQNNCLTSTDSSKLDGYAIYVRNETLLNKSNLCLILPSFLIKVKSCMWRHGRRSRGSADLEGRRHCPGPGRASSFFLEAQRRITTPPPSLHTSLPLVDIEAVRHRTTRQHGVYSRKQAAQAKGVQVLER